VVTRFLFIGLDLAGPYFENTDPRVRLDPADALFVDVIHTDGANNLLLGLGKTSFHFNINQFDRFSSGTLQRMGHVDFYPNGGYDQPNCPQTAGKIMNLFLQVSQMDIQGKVYLNSIFRY
jgi:hypothetical protein